MDIIFFLVGLGVGSILIWFIAKYKHQSQKGISKDELEHKYVLKQLYEEEKQNLEKKNEDYLTLAKEKASITQTNVHLEEQLEKQKEELLKIQNIQKTEFKNIASELLSAESKNFTETNQKNMEGILNPLKEKIKEFETKMGTNFTTQLKEVTSFRTEFKQLVELNKGISQDATNLTNALKGDSKIQGNWGEMQLERILQYAGLQKDIHYKKEQNLKTDDGKNQRPDYIIYLPDNKNLIIDSKVSLTAYERYFNAENENEKDTFLKQYFNSIKQHIKDLKEKDYSTLYGINSPDYIIMFVPLEYALNIALQKDIELHEKAWKQHIVLVSTSTLLATLRTISYIWTQENQKKNVDEIARESGKLYDKFVGFLTDMKKIEEKIDGAKDSYSDAMNKLTESTKKGDTIVGRIERLKTLGASTTKNIPQNVLEDVQSDMIHKQ